MNRRIVRALIGVALVGTNLVGFAASADAAGGEQGVLLLKGPGSLYGQPGNIATLSVAAGTAASFAFEVKNTGSSVAQYNIGLNTGGPACVSACSVSAVMTTGSLDVTGLASGPNGYYTAPIAPGAVALYSLKITIAKAGATPGDLVFYQLRLSDTALNQLGPVSLAAVNITRGTGTSGADQFVSSPGTPATSGNAASGYGAATSPSVAVGKTFSYAVKLMNDAATPTQISFNLQAQALCRGYFPVTVTQGSALSGTNVTSAVFGGTYSTAILAHGGSVTLTITGTSKLGGALCLERNHTGVMTWLGTSSDPGGDTFMNDLVFSPAS